MPDLPIVLVPGLVSSVRNLLADPARVVAYGSVMVVNQTRDDEWAPSPGAACRGAAAIRADRPFARRLHRAGDHAPGAGAGDAAGADHTSARLDTPESSDPPAPHRRDQGGPYRRCRRRTFRQRASLARGGPGPDRDGRGYAGGCRSRGIYPSADRDHGALGLRGRSWRTSCRRWCCPAIRIAPSQMNSPRRWPTSSRVPNS